MNFGSSLRQSYGMGTRECREEILSRIWCQNSSIQRMSGSPLLGEVLREIQFSTEDGALVTLKGGDG